MILDTLNLYHDDQAITGAGTVTGDVIDHNPGGHADMGAHGPNAADFEVLVQVSEATFTGGTIMRAELHESAAAASGFTQVVVGDDLAAAALTVGDVLLRVKRPNIKKRYSRVEIVSTGTFAVGKITAGVVAVPQAGIPTA